MNKLFAGMVFGALCLYVAILAHKTVFADDRVAPVRLDPDKIAGFGLTAVPPDAWQDILVSGKLNIQVATLFKGKELNVSIFESTPAKNKSPRAAD